MGTVQPGSVFASDYRVVRPLSEGGMGALWVVEQLSTGKLRALKLLHADMDGVDARRRFAQEARIGARLASEHVVEVIAAGVQEPDGTPWLVMELLEGEVLAARVERTGALAREVAGDVLNQLAHGLAAAHDKQVVHRDLKPENVFLAASRLADRPFLLKILDFGIAKIAAGDASATGAIGTPLWMAPEQADPDGRVTTATDIWALGLVAFFVLTGRSYWRSASATEISPAKVMRELVIDPLVPASRRASELGAPELPPGFDAWFARCVARDPHLRFQHAREAWVELAPILGQRTSQRDLDALASGRMRVASTPEMLAATQEMTPPDASPAAKRPATGEAVTLPRTTAGRPRGLLAAVAAIGAATLVGVAAFALAPRRAARPEPKVEASPAPPEPVVTPPSTFATALPSPAVDVDAGAPAPAASSRGSPVRTARPAAVSSPRKPTPPVAAPRPADAPPTTKPATKPPELL